VDAVQLFQKSDTLSTMVDHDVALKIAHDLPVGNVDVEIVVRRGGKLLGTVTVSRGGIDWKPSRARSSYTLNWTQFADLMSGKV